MSKIDKMLEQMCPNGVEYKAIKDIMRRNAGVNITAAAMKEKNCCDGDVRVFAAGKTEAMMRREDLDPQKIYETPSVMCKTRGYICFEYCDTPFTHKSELWSYSPLSDDINVKFYYYYLSSISNKLQEIAIANSVKLPQLKTGDTDNLDAPVPPIEIQNEIVKILDTFTELEAELEAELEGRKKQYKYYRDLLLSFDRAGEEGEGRFIEIFCEQHGIDFSCERDLEWKRVESVFSTVTPKRKIQKNELKASGQYRAISQGMKPYEGYIDDAEALFEQDEYVLFGDHTKIVKYEDGLFAQSADGLKVLKTVDKNSMLPRYLFHALSAATLPDRGYSRHWSLIKPVLLPIPPIDIQQFIVDTLDKFSAITEDLQNGLPREIELHRKQYEYYRSILFDLLSQ